MADSGDAGAGAGNATIARPPCEECARLRIELAAAAAEVAVEPGFKPPSAWAEREVRHKADRAAWAAASAELGARVEALSAEVAALRSDETVSRLEAEVAAAKAEADAARADALAARRELHDLRVATADGRWSGGGGGGAPPNTATTKPPTAEEAAAAARVAGVVEALSAAGVRPDAPGAASPTLPPASLMGARDGDADARAGEAGAAAPGLSPEQLAARRTAAEAAGLRPEEVVGVSRPVAARLGGEGGGGAAPAASSGEGEEAGPAPGTVPSLASAFSTPAKPDGGGEPATAAATPPPTTPGDSAPPRPADTPGPTAPPSPADEDAPAGAARRRRRRRRRGRQAAAAAEGEGDGGDASDASTSSSSSSSSSSSAASTPKADLRRRLAAVEARAAVDEAHIARLASALEAADAEGGGALPTTSTTSPPLTPSKAALAAAGARGRLRAGTRARESVAVPEITPADDEAQEGTATAPAAPHPRRAPLDATPIIPGLSEEEVEVSRLREEAATLMDELVRVKLELAEKDGEVTHLKRSVVREVGEAKAAAARLAAVKAHLLAKSGGAGLEPDTAALFVVGRSGSASTLVSPRASGE